MNAIMKPKLKKISMKIIVKNFKKCVKKYTIKKIITLKLKKCIQYKKNY